MKRSIIVAAMLMVFAARAQDAVPWWGALAADGKPDVLTGLVAWWKLDGNALDSVGSANGTVYNAVSASGKVGGGYYFNGTNAYIDVGGMLTRSNFTVSAWAKLDAFEETLEYYNGIFGDADAGQWGFGLRARNDDHKMQIEFVDGTMAYHVATDPTPVSFDTWTHWVAVRNDAQACLYRDGILVAEIYTVIASGPLRGATTIQTIGSAVTTANYWKGTIDEVRVYNRALSGDEILIINNRDK